MLKLVGKTESGTLVLSGVFKVYETLGIPLDAIFDCLKERNAIPDWLCFYVEAVGAGMKHDRILSKLEPAISDSYGIEMAKKVLEVLERAANTKV